MYGIVAGIGCQSMKLNHIHGINERTNEPKEMSMYDFRSFCQNLYEIYSSLGTVRLFSPSLKTFCGFFSLSPSSNHNPHAIVVFFFFSYLNGFPHSHSLTEQKRKKKRYIENTLIGFLVARWIPLISIYIQTISELDIRDKRLCCCSEQVTYDIFLLIFRIFFWFSFFYFYSRHLSSSYCLITLIFTRAPAVKHFGMKKK